MEFWFDFRIRFYNAEHIILVPIRTFRRIWRVYTSGKIQGWNFINIIGKQDMTKIKYEPMLCVPVF